MERIESIGLWNARRVTEGAIYMVWGLFQKMVIADRVAILVNNVFENFRMYGSVELLAGAAGFALQIYCDFASYSLIAIGAARILGFELMENFASPYLSRSIREFWSRWHISLSTWFKDYLYIPLGGNRRGRLRKALNILTVFLVSGLWHGANWTFIVWGGIHGAYQVAADALTGTKGRACARLRINTRCFSWQLLRTLLTFALVDVAWVFFRSDGIHDALRYFKRIVIRPNPWLLFNGGLFTLGLDRVEMGILAAAVLLLLLVDCLRYFKGVTISAFLLGQNLWFEWLAIIALILAIFIYGEYGANFDPQQFIYFQF